MQRKIVVEYPLKNYLQSTKIDFLLHFLKIYNLLLSLRIIGVIFFEYPFLTLKAVQLQRPAASGLHSPSKNQFLDFYMTKISQHRIAKDAIRVSFIEREESSSPYAAKRALLLFLFSHQYSYSYIL
jgi:hypothetical protein